MSSTHPKPDHSFDSFDIAILSALEADPRLTTVELAEIVHLSRTAVSKRITSLKESGVFRPNSNALDFSVLGFDIFASIELAPTSKSLDISKKKILEMPEVLCLIVPSGDSMLLIETVCVDMNHFRRFVRHLQQYGSTSTRIKFSSIDSPLSLVDRLKALRNHRHLD